MAKIENDWMDSSQAAHSSQEEAPPFASFDRKPGFASRTISFLGEVFTGKSKAKPVRAPMRSEEEENSTLSPYKPPPPAITPVQRSAERSEQGERQMLYMALKDLLDAEPGRRQLVKPLWTLEQNIKGLGVKGVEGMAESVTRTALLQLDALADYPNNGSLWKLRDVLVAANARHGPDVDPDEKLHIAQATDWQHRSDQPLRVAAVPAPLAGTPAPLSSHKIALPPRLTRAVPAGDATAIDYDMDDFFSPNLARDAAGPEVMEAHNLEPFIPAPAPKFELDLDMDLPALRQK